MAVAMAGLLIARQVLTRIKGRMPMTTQLYEQ
jgi:hypothetical protein